jgi:hypothetical protein
MTEKVYLITVKETEKLASFYEAYDLFDKAEKQIRKESKEWNRQIRETELKNEFKVYTNAGDYIHTLRIVDVWVR